MLQFGELRRAPLVRFDRGIQHLSRFVRVTRVGQYVREQNAWLWDMEPALHSTNKGLKMLAAQRELSNEELVLALLEATYGGPVRPTIWNPLFGAPQK